MMLDELRKGGAESWRTNETILILRAILRIFEDSKPLSFFLRLSTFLLAVSLVLVFASSTALTWLGTFAAMSGLILLVHGFVLDTRLKVRCEPFEVNLMRHKGLRPPRGDEWV